MAAKFGAGRHALSSNCRDGNVAEPRASAAVAIKMYSQAIAGAEGDAALFGNRSAAYLGAGLYQDAILDARKATALAPAWAKGFYRRAPKLNHESR